MAQEPWFKVLNKIGNHEKILEAGNTAAGIWLRMMACTSLNRNDGFVKDIHVAQIVPSVQQKDLQKLLDVGLVEKVSGGYYIVKYLKFNKSKEEIERETQKSSEGGQKATMTKEVKKLVANGEAHPLAAEHQRLYNKYPAWQGAAASIKWLDYCAKNINTEKDVKDLGDAIDAYTDEQKRMARSKGISFEEQKKFIRAPSHFLEDKETGVAFWRYVLAANDTPIIKKETSDAANKPKKPIQRELLPWVPKLNDEPEVKEALARNWPEDEQRKWIDDRLQGKSDGYRRRWLAAHEMTHLYPELAAEVTS